MNTFTAFNTAVLKIRMATHLSNISSHIIIAMNVLVYYNLKQQLKVITVYFSYQKWLLYTCNAIIFNIEAKNIPTHTKSTLYKATSIICISQFHKPLQTVKLRKSTNPLASLKELSKNT